MKVRYYERRKDMDELKIKSAVMTALISKIIKTALRKSVGYDIDIQLNECCASVKEGKVHFNINADGEISVEDISKILRGNGMI